MTDSNLPQTFAELGLSEPIRAAVEAQGWTEPTPIQKRAIPHGLAGRDIVGIAQTGTGKTGAFMIPALEKIEAGKGLQCLILAPTRELAQQVADDTALLSKGTSIRVEAIYGGVGYGPQNDALSQGFEVIAATPGRFIDHMGRGNVDLTNLHYFILDEADRMLDMGFRPQIEEVMRRVPGKRQTMLFSATMPNGVHDLALRLTKDAIWTEAAPQGTTAEGIEEKVFSVKPEKKSDLLLHLLQNEEMDQVLIFSRTKAGADVLQSRLERVGIKTSAMHSDRSMKERQGALEDFAEGRVRVLVATDVAQRGLDVEGISHVINFDVPQDPEDYVHRIGRTGRAGASGHAFTFVTAGDLGSLKTLEHHLKRELPREHIEEFDYVGGPREDTSRGSRAAHSRSPHGMGSKAKKQLSEEELKKLLGHG